MKFNIKEYARVLSAVVALTYSATTFGQAPSQTFTVVVGDVLSVTAPEDLSINHDETDADQTFSVANWPVLSNNAAGATVDFTTDAVFVNGTTERDLVMTVSVVSTDNDASSNPVWAVTPALTTYSSDYANSDVDGQVQAASAGPGNATLGLAMTFVDDDYSLLPSGNYVVEVTATITAN